MTSSSTPSANSSSGSSSALLSRETPREKMATAAVAAVAPDFHSFIQGFQRFMCVVGNSKQHRYSNHSGWPRLSVMDAVGPARGPVVRLPGSRRRRTSRPPGRRRKLPLAFDGGDAGVRVDRVDRRRSLEQLHAGVRIRRRVDYASETSTKTLPPFVAQPIVHGHAGDVLRGLGLTGEHSRRNAGVAFRESFRRDGVVDADAPVVATFRRMRRKN